MNLKDLVKQLEDIGKKLNDVYANVEAIQGAEGVKEAEVKIAEDTKAIIADIQKAIGDLV
ncbi:MAG: hypothetical protein F4059_09700 [Gemmatimonadetes bacterium]|nr:hypothetical protein [Gemmatimonadota bacterium]